MKKWILLGGVLALLAWGKSDLDRASDLLEEGNATQAYPLAKAVFQKDMANPQANFFLGRAAFETGRFNEAIAAFERVLFVDPGHLRARLELGRTYLALRLYTQAQMEFEAVLLQPIPPQVRQSIQSYLAVIQEASQSDYITAFLSLGFQDDTNINNGNDYTDTLLGIQLNPVVSDQSVLTTLMVHHLRRIDAKDRFWENRATIYRQEYMEEHDSDIRFLSVSTGPMQRYGNLTFHLPVSLQSLTYGGQEKYRASDIGADFEKPLSKKSQAVGGVHLLQKRYIPDLDDGRDSTTLQLTGAYREALETGALLGYNGLVAFERKGNEGSRNDVDHNRFQAGVSFFDTISAKGSYQLSAVLRWQRYVYKTAENAAGTEISRKEDLAVDLSAGLMLPLDKSSYLQAYYRNIRNDSSQELFDYNKEAFGITYNHTFTNDWIQHYKEQP